MFNLCLNLLHWIGDFCPKLIENRKFKIVPKEI